MKRTVTIEWETLVPYKEGRVKGFEKLVGNLGENDPPPTCHLKGPLVRFTLPRRILIIPCANLLRFEIEEGT